MPQRLASRLRAADLYDVFVAGCDACPIRALHRQQDRSLVTRHSLDAVTRAPRAAVPDRVPPGPADSRTLDLLAVAGGNRRRRFRGTARNDQWLRHRATGLNLHHLLALGPDRATSGWTNPRLTHRPTPRPGPAHHERDAGLPRPC